MQRTWLLFGENENRYGAVQQLKRVPLDDLLHPRPQHGRGGGGSSSVFCFYFVHFSFLLSYFTFLLFLFRAFTKKNKKQLDRWTSTWRRLVISGNHINNVSFIFHYYYYYFQKDSRIDLAWLRVRCGISGRFCGRAPGGPPRERKGNVIGVYTARHGMTARRL